MKNSAIKVDTPFSKKIMFFMTQPPFKARRDSNLIPLLCENTSIVKSSSRITSAKLILKVKIVYTGTRNRLAHCRAK